MTRVNPHSSVRSLEQRIAELERQLRVTLRVRGFDPDERPEAPTGLNMNIRIRETKTHHEYSAVVSCDPLTPDTCQADIRQYIFQIRPCDAGGNPQDGTNVRTKSQTSRQLIDSDNVNPHVVFQELERPKRWHYQARARILDRDDRFSPWTAWSSPQLPTDSSLPEPPAPTFGLTPITFNRVGKGKRRRIRLNFTFDEVTNWDVPGGDHEDDMHHYVVVVDRSDDGITWDGAPWFRKDSIPARLDAPADATRTIHFYVPKGQYYRCRVYSVDRYGRRGDPSGWTEATLPFDDVQPPQPTNVRIYDDSVDRIVIDWDAPTSDYPTRGTVSGTSGTDTLTGVGTRFTVEIREGATVKVGGNTYVVKDIASNTSLTLTTNLTTSPSGAVLYEVDEHFDVAFYLVQLAQSSQVDLSQTPDRWTAVYKKDRTTGTRKEFKIPSQDQDLTFYGRVFAVDALRNKSRPVTATTAGNSDPDANGTAVSLGVTAAEAKGRKLIIWTIPGTVQAKHYDTLWVADQKYKPIKIHAHAGRHESADHPANDGTPGGSDCVINMRVHDAAESSTVGLMAIADRLRIPANGHKDTVWAADFAVTSIQEGEAISPKVANAGSTRAAKNVKIYLLVEEDNEDSIQNVTGFAAKGRGRGTMVGTLV